MSAVSLQIELIFYELEENDYNSFKVSLEPMETILQDIDSMETVDMDVLYSNFYNYEQVLEELASYYQEITLTLGLNHTYAGYINDFEEKNYFPIAEGLSDAITSAKGYYMQADGRGFIGIYFCPKDDITFRQNLIQSLAEAIVSGQEIQQHEDFIQLMQLLKNKKDVVVFYKDLDY